ncbi:PHB depolymerase family esterase [Streptomyces sp. NPDC018610]|uniref:extracellular catalytic domain type 1 short-chain-length polyhydroxyalkanoate depolymerase n=1 Tax=Streptomyces sp. NPDC018610 TaxID=3365049 RepID=UPI0037BCD524
MRLPTLRGFGRRAAWAAALGALAAGLVTLTPLAPAAEAAGTLQQVTNFGSNPGNLTMYEYAPAGLPANAPLVVALHGCTQSASDYHTHSGWQKFADQWGFAVVYPQTGTANNSLSCFSWFDSAKDARGKGEAASVAQMVDHAAAQYGSDRARIFVTGLSAGGGMTADLLADYPDVFAGGAVDSGLPAQCATTQAAASGCQYSGQNLTPKQWGDKVRGSYPGYSGPWPRVAIWQGTSDTTVAPVNGTELRDQWTDVWGVGQTATATQNLTGNTTESIYADAAGKPAVALFSVSGMAHGLAVDPGSGADQCGSTGAYYLDTICSSYHTAKFWGLDRSGGDSGGGGALPAPSSVTVAATTDTGVTLSWNAVGGAASYKVYRDGAAVGSPTGTTYTDTGLSAGTSYRYTVAAVDAAGAVGAASAPVTATTTGAVPAPKCYTDNNYNQVRAGRAHQSGGYTYANGSNQNMGLYNVAITHTLKETSPAYFVLADSGC